MSILYTHHYARLVKDLGGGGGGQLMGFKIIGVQAQDVSPKRD